MILQQKKTSNFSKVTWMDCFAFALGVLVVDVVIVLHRCLLLLFLKTKKHKFWFDIMNIILHVHHSVFGIRASRFQFSQSHSVGFCVNINTRSRMTPLFVGVIFIIVAINVSGNFSCSHYRSPGTLE